MIKYITIDLSIASKVERPMNRSDGTWTTARISDGAKATNRNRRNFPPIYSTHPSACVVAGPKMLLAYPHGNHIWAWIQPQPRGPEHLGARGAPEAVGKGRIADVPRQDHAADALGDECERTVT
jgi:hypothetical protein